MSPGPRAAWTPSIGAWVASGGTTFRVWAPTSSAVEVLIERPSGPESHPLTRAADGTHSGTLPGVRAGDRYRYRLDHDRTLPDPASRFQPDGVHGVSQVVDPSAFGWTDARWPGLDLDRLVLYEAHVGTFSPEGTFAGMTARLPQLAALGVTAVELMPVADFPGTRNWGYDGVALFAPARCYGTPDDLRRLVDTAHGLGLGVFLDVVYNHLGPDGAYLQSFSPFYFTERHQTPWGAGLNFDGEHSEMVRGFFIENARHWTNEYHFDGLRLDATHAIADDSPRHFLAEFSARVRDTATGRPVLIVAEDHRNLRHMLEPEAEGGWGLDGVWADDLHHQCRRLLAGDTDAYYRDFTGSTEDLAETIRRGWYFTGQPSIHLGEPRGTDPTGIPAPRFVTCLQNHDQIGNRALGGRLHHEIDPAAYRAASALFLMAPETPLLFMGQEWAATSPFLYFNDHNAELGRLVTEGRRSEFGQFTAFSDPAARERIPDPQAESTFASSRLLWDERLDEPHASMLRLYQALLELRRREPALAGGTSCRVEALDDGTIAMRRDGARSSILVVARLAGFGVVTLDDDWIGARLIPGDSALGAWQPVLTTEDQPFSTEPLPPIVDGSQLLATIRFIGPAAIVLVRALPSPVDRVGAEAERSASDVVDAVVSAPRLLPIGVEGATDRIARAQPDRQRGGEDHAAEENPERQ